MDIVVLGADGQLGTDLVDEFGGAAAGLTKEEVDVTRPEEVAEITEMSPDAVINTAAFIRVRAAEDSAEEAFAVNAAGALNVARAAEECGATCLYIGTDYVFDGRDDDPYTEDDTPNPLNVYGTSKYAGELLTRNYCTDHYIVRTSSLFGTAGPRGDDRNFVETITGKAQQNDEIEVVNDIVMSPTYTGHLAAAIARLLEVAPPAGTYHLTNDGAATWYDFAEEIVRQQSLDAEVVPVSAERYDDPVQRPDNSSLANTKAAKHDITLPSWQDGLSAYLQERDADGV